MAMLNNQMVIGRDGVLNFCQPYLGWGESSKSAILGGTVPELRTPTWIHMVIDQGGLTKWTDPASDTMFGPMIFRFSTGVVSPTMFITAMFLSEQL